MENDGNGYANLYDFMNSYKEGSDGDFGTIVEEIQFIVINIYNDDEGVDDGEYYGLIDIFYGF